MCVYKADHSVFHIWQLSYFNATQWGKNYKRPYKYVEYKYLEYLPSARFLEKPFWAYMIPSSQKRLQMWLSHCFRYQTTRPDYFLHKNDIYAKKGVNPQNLIIHVFRVRKWTKDSYPRESIKVYSNTIFGCVDSNLAWVKVDHRKWSEILVFLGESIMYP